MIILHLCIVWVLIAVLFQQQQIGCNAQAPTSATTTTTGTTATPPNIPNPSVPSKPSANPANTPGNRPYVKQFRSRQPNFVPLANVKNLSELAADYPRTVAALSSTDEEIFAAIDELAGKLEYLEQLQRSATGDEEDVVEQVQGLVQKVEALKTERDRTFQELQQVVKTLQNQQSTQENSMQSFHQLVQGLKSEFEQSNLAISKTVEETTAASTSEIAEMNRKFTDFESKELSKSLKIDDLMNKVNTLIVSVTDLKKTEGMSALFVQKQQAAADELKMLREQVDADISTLRVHMTQQQEQAAREMTAMNNLVQTLSQSHITASQGVTEQRQQQDNEVKDLKSQVLLLNNNVDDIQQHIQGLREGTTDQLDQLRASLNGIRTFVSEQSENVVNLYEQLETAHEAIKQSRSHLETTCSLKMSEIETKWAMYEVESKEIASVASEQMQQLQHVMESQVSKHHEVQAEVVLNLHQLQEQFNEMHQKSEFMEQKYAEVTQGVDNKIQDAVDVALVQIAEWQTSSQTALGTFATDLDSIQTTQRESSFKIEQQAKHTEAIINQYDEAFQNVMQNMKSLSNTLQERDRQFNLMAQRIEGVDRDANNNIQQLERIYTAKMLAKDEAIGMLTQEVRLLKQAAKDKEEELQTHAGLLANLTNKFDHLIREKDRKKPLIKFDGVKNMVKKVQNLLTKDLWKGLKAKTTASTEAESAAVIDVAHDDASSTGQEEIDTSTTI